MKRFELLILLAGVAIALAGCSGFHVCFPHACFP